MKKPQMMMLAIIGLSALLTESQATMLARTRLDHMTQTTGTSAWYAAQATPGFDTQAVAVHDPRDPATDVMNYGASSYWFEYKTVPGKTFDYVDVCLDVFDASGSGCYNGIALSYSADGVTYTDVAPTTAETYVVGGAGWSLYGRQYDLHGLNATYVKLIKYANNTYTWSTAISSVYLEVSQATMLAGTHLDYMTQTTGTSVWYAAQATPGFDTQAVAVDDPRDPAPDVMNYGASSYWFEYKAVPGKTFDYVDVCLDVFDASGSGFYNGIALSYSADGVTYNNLAPTAAETYVDGGAGWSLYGRQYDLHGLNATYIKLIKYANDTYTWSTAISSVYLELVPDTIFADDVNWKELRSTMEMVHGGILDFYRPEEAPAGKYGFLKVVGDHFEFAQRPGNAVRFYGANLCFYGVMMNHGDADHMADHLAWCGYNAVRLHHFDELLTLNMPLSTDFDPARLDEMDYLVAALKQRGVYITLDFYTLRPIPQSELSGVNVPQIRDEVKLLTYVNTSVRDNMYTFTANLMNHVNPYTGLAWKNDPAITHISLLNENTLFDLLNLLPEAKRQYELAFDNSPVGQESYPSDAAKELARRTFYSEIFKTGFQDFQNYLRTLGVQVPLTDFNCGNTGLMYPIRETRDYVDNHGYFDHPVFLGDNWQLPYQISNQSSMDSLIEPLTQTASSRIFGKPFTVTEWNFCFPNSYAVEGAFLTGAYAALQDWSGIYRFCYTDKKDNINGAGAFELTMFNVVDDPIRLLSERAGVCFFRRGDVRVATPCFPSAISRNLSELPDQDFVMSDSARLGMFLGRIGATVGTATSAVPLNSATVVPLDSGMAARQWPVPVLDKTLTGKTFLAALAQQSGLGARCFQPEPFRLTSDTGEIVLEPDAEKFTVATSYSEGALLKGGGTADLPFLRIANHDGFAAFLAASTDGKPLMESKRILLLHLTESKNSGMEFSDCRRQVVNVLGRVPVLIRRGNAEVTLKRPFAGFRLYAVDLTGKRTFEVPLKSAGTDRVFDADTFAADGVTLAYELVGNESCSVVLTFDAAGGTVNPASQTVFDSFAYGTLPVPARTGYAFDGWWTGENGTGAEVTADTVVANRRGSYAVREVDSLHLPGAKPGRVGAGKRHGGVRNGRSYAVQQPRSGGGVVLCGHRHGCGGRS